MLPEVGTTYVFKERSWEPVVKNEGGNLIYHMPVACGHIDKHFKFSISAQEFEVLEADVERRYFLYALLHSQYQSQPISGTVKTDDGFQNVLFGSKKSVEKLLSTHDVETNCAVSNLVRLLMKRERQPMIEGCWFKHS